MREQFGLSPGQQLQVIALPGRIELVPSQRITAAEAAEHGLNMHRFCHGRAAPSRPITAAPRAPHRPWRCAPSGGGD
ncbi:MULTISPECIES: AbrB/MazE/SpoVT family DNA-binding domain-containing protein [Synechococcales]|uniref:AbrB/MazE/SpoVT family DNA-binding domain-containing protein n=1 Tax=Synechococcus sp. CS-1324 TaxID=2847980 RepID=UPI00223BD84F|nr:AbrB/MazE/SpoVT family DNA-binding domain-containing protein [Synechococcus sp. CS-1324]